MNAHEIMNLQDLAESSFPAFIECNRLREQNAKLRAALEALLEASPSTDEMTFARMQAQKLIASTTVKG